MSWLQGIPCHLPSHISQVEMLLEITHPNMPGSAGQLRVKFSVQCPYIFLYEDCHLPSPRRGLFYLLLFLAPKENLVRYMFQLEDLGSPGENSTARLPSCRLHGQRASYFPYQRQQWVLTTVLLMTNIHCLKIPSETQDGSFGRTEKKKVNWFSKDKFLSQNQHL